MAIEKINGILKDVEPDRADSSRLGGSVLSISDSAAAAEVFIFVPRSDEGVRSNQTHYRYMLADARYLNPAIANSIVAGPAYFVPRTRVQTYLTDNEISADNKVPLRNFFNTLGVMPGFHISVCG